MTPISANLQVVHARIDAAARRAGRNPDDIWLLAVSKTWSTEDVREAAEAGQRAFGENYVQEACTKAETLAELGLEWHFIGPLQSNKTKPVAERFDWVHSVERLKIAERLSAQRPATMKPLNICVQVNVSGELSKSGCALDEAAALARAIVPLPGLRLRGLMCIPEPTDNPAEQAQAFAKLRLIYEQLRIEGLSLDTLSMGMSHDLEAAIAEGATIVRIGTAIFGDRQKT